MSKLRWNTPKDLRALLCELVSWKSMTLSEGERQFPMKLHAKLQDLAYFQTYPDQLALHDADLRGNFLTALYKNPKQTESICLLTNFDKLIKKENGEFEILPTQP